jgi:hypothetical protein
VSSRRWLGYRRMCCIPRHGMYLSYACQWVVHRDIFRQYHGVALTQRAKFPAILPARCPAAGVLATRHGTAILNRSEHFSRLASVLVDSRSSQYCVGSATFGQFRTQQVWSSQNRERFALRAVHCGTGHVTSESVSPQAWDGRGRRGMFTVGAVGQIFIGLGGMMFCLFAAGHFAFDV